MRLKKCVSYCRIEFGIAVDDKTTKVKIYIYIYYIIMWLIMQLNYVFILIAKFWFIVSKSHFDKYQNFLKNRI